jgi:hypothetical protein
VKQYNFCFLEPKLCGTEQTETGKNEDQQGKKRQIKVKQMKQSET